MEVVHTEIVQSLLWDLENEFGHLGFEFHAFKIGWYNLCVKPVFYLNYDEDTVAVLIVSTPGMFENSFMPYLEKASLNAPRVRDPLDDCMISTFSRLNEIFPAFDVELVHDFELYPNRRPKILMQTAAHVSGAAYFYQRCDLKEDCFGNKKIYGVCIHPNYGGWFALRGIAIFKNIKCPNLLRSNPHDVLKTEQAKAQLLNMYNFHWKDWAYRDIIPTAHKYSDQQIKYFSTPPEHRARLIKEMLNTKEISNNS